MLAYIFIISMKHKINFYVSISKKCGKISIGGRKIAKELSKH